LTTSSPVSDALRSVSTRTPVWLWPNLLSLDAPVIAALWQAAFASDVGVKLTLASRTALPLAVWLIYLVDRLLDTANGIPAKPTARHAFYCAQRDGCYVLTLLVGLLLCVSVWFLPLPVVENGMMVAGTVALYLLTVHIRRGKWRRWLPKEAAVGLIFGIGTTLAPFTWASNSGRLVFPALIFGVLCWTNSAAIEIWEGGRVDCVSAWVVQHMKTVAAATCVCCLPLLYLHWAQDTSMALAISALGYWGVADMHLDLDANSLRVAMDVPLLAPLLLLGLR
jgi:hypothetical protein